MGSGWWPLPRGCTMVGAVCAILTIACVSELFKFHHPSGEETQCLCL